ncbi:YvbH-like oligomerization domain-containing protein [Phocoenobacter skyensis]
MKFAKKCLNVTASYCIGRNLSTKANITSQFKKTTATNYQYLIA